MKKTPNRLVVDIDEETHKEIKIRALDRGITLKDYVLQALLERIAREKQYE